MLFLLGVLWKYGDCGKWLLISMEVVVMHEWYPNEDSIGNLIEKICNVICNVIFNGICKWRLYFGNWKFGFGN